jgi:anti-sigma factor RsiW
MSCGKAKKRIPLFVGGELSEREAGRVRRHLETCPACRAEAAEIETARTAVRRMAEAGSEADWTTAEWSRMIREITRQPEERRTVRASLKLRPALAMALGVLVLVGLTIVQRELNRPAAPETGAFAVVRPEIPDAAVEPAPTKDPEVKSVTIVSPDSGLRIHWFYNKRFEWQGFGK